MVAKERREQACVAASVSPDVLSGTSLGVTVSPAVPHHGLRSVTGAFEGRARRAPDGLASGDERHHVLSSAGSDKRVNQAAGAGELGVGGGRIPVCPKGAIHLVSAAGGAPDYVKSTGPPGAVGGDRVIVRAKKVRPTPMGVGRRHSITNRGNAPVAAQCKRGERRRRPTKPRSARPSPKRATTLGSGIAVRSKTPWPVRVANTS